MTMSAPHNEQPSENNPKQDGRIPWERPILRRLAANEAQNGTNRGNDGSGGGAGRADPS
jgi:hypothetical protein